MKKYLCVVCGYIYDPAKGDSDSGIAPGTAFEDIPEDWTCPVCGVSKNDFVPYEEEVSLSEKETKYTLDKAYNEIVKDVFSVGSEHWDRELFDELIPLPDGTSYNAYLIRTGGKNILIDTVDPEKIDDLMENLFEMEIDKIDYIISNHAEQDHSGGIPFILAEWPDAKVITNPKCKSMLIDLLDLDEDIFITVSDGEKMKIGEKTFEFIYTPWVHWPETMSTYLVEDKILFSCDFFGSHRATSHSFVYDENKVVEDAKRYYAEIMMPFRTHIKKNIAKVEEREIKYIAPSHGPVYDNPKIIIDAYKDWISPKVTNKVIVAYVSMHGSTEIIADYVIKSLTQNKITVVPFNLIKTDIGHLTMELVDAATVIIASPMVLGGAHPQAVYAAYLINALRPKIRHIGIIGSYGWGGKMVDQLKDLLKNVKAEIIEPVMVKGLPKDKDIEPVDKFIEKIVELHKKL